MEDTKKMNKALKEINELPISKPEIKIQVRFKKENIEKEELSKECNFIDINGINIHNIIPYETRVRQRTITTRWLSAGAAWGPSGTSRL